MNETGGNWLVSLALSFLFYSIIPICIACFTSKPIGKKKYWWLCFGLNFVIALALKVLEVIVYGDIAPNGLFPYLLWTTVANSIGRSILLKKNCSDPMTDHQIENSSVVFFCKECKSVAPGLSYSKKLKCSNCGKMMVKTRIPFPQWDYLTEFEKTDFERKWCNGDMTVSTGFLEELKNRNNKGYEIAAPNNSQTKTEYSA